MKRKEFKRCPRCDKKTPIYQDRCEGCGLIFSRLARASNAAAKKAIKKKEYNKVIMDKVLPKDVNKWKLFLWSLLGLFGVHYAKVGRYKMFTYGLCSTAGLYIAVCLPNAWFDHKYLFMLMWGLVLNASMYTIIYIVSMCQILFNKFKVPIAIDEELVVESLDQELVKDILKEVKNTKDDNLITRNEKLQIDKKKYNRVKAKQTKMQNTITETTTEEENIKVKKEKRKKIKVVCVSCGAQVKVYNDEEICPKCDEPLKDD